jgi:hypothetical protein
VLIGLHAPPSQRRAGVTSALATFRRRALSAYPDFLGGCQTRNKQLPDDNMAGIFEQSRNGGTLCEL